MRPKPANHRHPDWPERLAAIIEARRDTPFQWGVHDCCTWAADVAVALTGRDPAGGVRGRYASEEEQDAILATQGGLEAAVARAMAGIGAPACAPAFAARGDCALVMIGNQAIVGVVIGDRIAVPGLGGLQFVPLRLATRAWAIYAPHAFAIED